MADLFDPKGLQKFVESRRKPVDLLPASGNWISARDARHWLSELLNVPHAEAERAICRRACRWIQVRCETFSRREDPIEGIDRVKFFKDREIDLSHFSEAPLPDSWEEMLAFFEKIQDPNSFGAWDDGDRSDWITGDFEITLHQDFSDVKLDVVGLMFDRDRLWETFGLQAIDANVPAVVEPTARLQPSAQRESRRGGRPAKNHGEAVARVLLNMLDLSDGDLRTYTYSVVASELADGYREFGEHPPSQDNLDRIAMGILRALKAKGRI